MPVSERDQPLAVVGFTIEVEVRVLRQSFERRQPVAPDPLHLLHPCPSPLPQAQDQPQQCDSRPAAFPSHPGPHRRVWRREAGLPPDRHEGVQQDDGCAGCRCGDDVLMHLAVEEDQIRPHVMHSVDEPAHSKRGLRLLTAEAQVQKFSERCHAGIGSGELIVVARVQWQKLKTAKLDEPAVFGARGKRHAISGGSQTPAELHARVEQAWEPACHDEDVGHGASTPPDRLWRRT